MKVLNVGGGNCRSIPETFDGWEQDLLDIDPAVKPDICLDAREMKQLPPATYDAVYCSHTLEHFYRHEILGILEGFVHVLKKDGFIEVAVPNMQAMFLSIAQGNLDIEDVWYRSPAGPIMFHDVIYGFSKQMERGNLFYAHKCGFSAESLCRAISRVGFKSIQIIDQSANLGARAYKEEQPCR
jgi:ubiquinone/menaquinone biosynthesis C-methylase UbiE